MFKITRKKLKKGIKSFTGGFLLGLTCLLLSINVVNFVTTASQYNNKYYSSILFFIFYATFAIKLNEPFRNWWFKKKKNKKNKSDVKINLLNYFQ